MSNVVKFSATPVAEVAAFPEAPSVRWRREFARCETYHDTLELCFRMIRQMERDEKAARKRAAADAHQLAFPWARVD